MMGRAGLSSVKRFRRAGPWNGRARARRPCAAARSWDKRISLSSMNRRAPKRPRDERPIRVAIIGGGCAGMATAFELSRPELRGRYEITVYQIGHRLGGKGASGRGPHGRIEEHGLHLWMGYYENAFRMMRRCFRELRRDPRTCPIVDIETAFEPAPRVGLTERLPSGDWFPWLASFPMAPGMPGDPLDDPDPFSLKSYLVRAGELLVELVRSAHDREDPRARSPAMAPERGPAIASDHRGRRPASHRRSRRRAYREGDVMEAIDRALKYGQLATAAAIIEAAETFHAGLATLLPRGARSLWDASPLVRLADALGDAVRRQLDVLLEADDELRRVWEVVDILLALARGVLRAGIAFRRDGLDALDAYDYREWLYDNGASPRSLDGAFLRGVYDLLFAYEGGDPRRPRFAAGVAVRGTLRMFFGYRGALFFRMNAGMGDVIFAPLYEVLRRRGVRFAFFHRLRDVHVAPEEDVPHGEEPWVTQLDFDVQAQVVDGEEYEPLVDVKGLPCWPSKPLFDQLVNGAELEREGANFESHWDRHRAEGKTLLVGRDFDFAVLATGLGAVPHVAPSLLSRSSRFRSMVANVKTVATQAFQLWMTEDMKSLGWHGGRVNVSAFAPPFDTWADMTHLLRRESWPLPVRSIAYFCAVLPDIGDPEDEAYPALCHARVRKNAVHHLRREVDVLWPHSKNREGDFRWDLLARPEGQAPSGAEPAAPGAEGPPSGEARFDSQYWVANVSPSERYAMALPGTTAYRISPLDPGFSNFTVAGDWTESGLNCGCVESAVMSGKLAAHALSGFPALSEITGYDHP